MTKKDLAQDMGVTVRTIERYLQAGHNYPEWLDIVNNGQPFPYGAKDELPSGAVSYLKDKKAAPGPPFPPKIEFSTVSQGALLATDPKEHPTAYKEDVGINDKWGKEFKTKPQGFQKNVNGSHKEGNEAVEPAVETSDIFDTIKTKLSKMVDTAVEKAVEKHIQAVELSIDPITTSTRMSDRILGGDFFSLAMLFVLIAADSYSLGLIAYSEFQDLKVATGWGAVGFAIAFASIRNIIKVPTVAAGYTSKNLAAEKGRRRANAWLWGFGVVQFLLHAAAYRLFSINTYQDLSMAVGRVTICLAIPFATAGLAITYKPVHNEKRTDDS